MMAKQTKAEDFPIRNLSHEMVRDFEHFLKTKKREKTDVEFYVPLLDLPLQILEKYKNHPLCKARGTVLPVYANQKMNSYLKEIADFCENAPILKIKKDYGNGIHRN